MGKRIQLKKVRGKNPTLVRIYSNTYNIIIYTENIQTSFKDMELILFPLTSYPEETNIYIIQKEGK